MCMCLKVSVIVQLLLDKQQALQMAFSSTEMKIIIIIIIIIIHFIHSQTNRYNMHNNS